MDADLAHELKTINAKVEGALVVRQNRRRDVIGVVEGKPGKLHARVTLPDGREVTTPVYRTKTDLMFAVCLPFIANIRGEAWDWPTAGQTEGA